MKKIYNSKGFTLIEFLAVTIVLVSVGMLAVAILGSTLRGTNKTNSINAVRQNGNHAITQMSRMIGYAKSFDGVSTDGISYTTGCIQTPVVAPTPTPTPTQYNFLKITSFDGGQTVFSCSSTSISSNSASLIDTNSVAIDSCWFSCSQGRITDNPIIKINLNLKQIGSSVFVENKSTIGLETSITVRNFGR